MMYGYMPVRQSTELGMEFRPFIPTVGSQPPTSPFAAMQTQLNLMPGVATSGNNMATVTSDPRRPSTVEVVGGVVVDVVNSVLRRRGSDTQVGVVVGQGAPGGGVSAGGGRVFEAGTTRDRAPLLYWAGLALAAYGLYKIVKG